MNKHILFVMRSLNNPELFTREEKEDNNRNTAYAYAAAAIYDAHAAYAYADAAYDAAYDADAAERWIKEFFIKTGEDKQVYIDEVERLKGE